MLFDSLVSKSEGFAFGVKNSSDSILDMLVSKTGVLLRGEKSKFSSSGLIGFLRLRRFRNCLVVGVTGVASGAKVISTSRLFCADSTGSFSFDSSMVSDDSDRF